MEQAEHRRATAADVAQRAGVHSSTVSRALSPTTRHRISAPVVERVLAAARELGYHPDAAAASMRSGRTKIIALLVPEIANSLFAMVLRGAAEVLEAAGYLTVVGELDARTKSRRELIDRLAARQVDGLIVATASTDDPLVRDVIGRGLPVVLINRAERAAEVPSVLNDDGVSMALAVDHLMSLGHRCMAHLAGPPETSTGQDRREGFRLAVIQAGLPEQVCVAAAQYDREAGRLAAMQILKQDPNVTAIVAANDLLAIGCLDTLRERGLRCPRDISVVGHNDLFLMDAIDPPLTTIRVAAAQMGREAASLLLRGLTGDVRDVHIRLRPQLVERASTAAIRTRRPERGVR